MLIEALENVLAQDAGMQTFVGTPATRSDGTTGIFPTQAIEEPTMSYIVLSQVSGQPLSTTMQGTGRLTTERWRLSCYGSTYRNAKTFAKYVRQFVISLDGPQPAGSAEIHGAWVERGN